MELLNQLSIPRALSLFPTLKLDANCLSSDAVGHCVYVTGSKVGELYQVTKANPLDGATKMPSIGVLVEKLDAVTCKVQVTGVMEGIVSGLTPGRAVFVSSSGTIGHSLAVPGPGSYAYIQPMGVALDDEVVLVMPDLSIIKRLG